jgi:hypothetical protein
MVSFCRCINEFKALPSSAMVVTDLINITRPKKPNASSRCFRMIQPEDADGVWELPSTRGKHVLTGCGIQIQVRGYGGTPY